MMKIIVRWIFIAALMAPLCARAQDRQSYAPTSGWLVGPAAAGSDGGTALPCIMMNQFDNGFVFRFSGGDKRLLALAVDFRQQVFTQGRHYPLTLTIAPSFGRKLDAVAYNGAVLIVSAQDVQLARDLYRAVARGENMTLSFGQKSFDFTLTGAADGLRRMESCYAGKGASAAVRTDDEAEATPPAMPDIAARPESPLPPAAGIDRLLGQAAGKLNAAAATPASSWQARAGDSLRETLTRWSRQAGAALVWPAAEDFKVRESLNVEGGYEQAVQSLLAEYKAGRRPVGALTVDPKSGEKRLQISQVGK